MSKTGGLLQIPKNYNLTVENDVLNHWILGVLRFSYFLDTSMSVIDKNPYVDSLPTNW
jgi:hypothetical protein